VPTRKKEGVANEKHAGIQEYDNSGFVSEKGESLSTHKMKRLKKVGRYDAKRVKGKTSEMISTKNDFDHSTSTWGTLRNKKARDQGGRLTGISDTKEKKFIRRKGGGK